MVFIVDRTYTKKDIYRILEVPEEKRKGAWDTGYHKFKNDWFIFVNIGIPGRTGHDYDNYWIGDDLLWRGKNESKLSHPSIKSMLEPDGKIYIFTREKNDDPFVFEGTATAKDWKDTVPVTILWQFNDFDENRPERLAEEIIVTPGLKEGAVKRIEVNIYERAPYARRLCIKKYGVKCIVCGFDFERIYGKVGEGFIHVHHIVPLSEIGDTYEVDPIKDLRPVCPNCHAMLHRRNPAMTIDELKEFIRVGKMEERF